jgi:renalase
VSLLLASARTVVSTEIASIRRTPRGTFALATPDANPSLEQHEFDVVVVATAPTDAATLVAPHAERLAAYARAAKVSPCWAASIVTQSSGQSKAPDLIIPSKDTPLGWIARNASKPGRAQSHVADFEGWVAHATAEWSADHLSDTADNASKLLVDAFTSAIRYATGAAPDIVHAEAQLWRQAKAARAPDGTPPAAMESGIVLCGDYLIAGRVEAAYLSGKAAARLVSGG